MQSGSLTGSGTSRRSGSHHEIVRSGPLWLAIAASSRDRDRGLPRLRGDRAVSVRNLRSCLHFRDHSRPMGDVRAPLAQAFRGQRAAQPVRASSRVGVESNDAACRQGAWMPSMIPNDLKGRALARDLHIAGA